MQTRDQPSADPSASLRTRLISGRALVAGVLSGTSADGIDVALVRFEPGHGSRLGRPRCVGFETRPFDSVSPDRGRETLERRVRRLLDGTFSGPAELALLDRDLGRAFGCAVELVAESRKLEVELIASHGQTVWHHDGSPAGAATMQLGDGCEVAEVANCAVVSDFRKRDIAAGGEGAPLSALTERELFGPQKGALCVLNLGGISNLTWLPAENSEPTAFDCGPAGSLLDGLSRRLLDRPFDRGGAVAARGTASEALIAEWGGHAFFDRAPPRSTGRDTFGEDWVDSLFESAAAELSTEDFLRTAAEFVAECIARSLREQLPEALGAPIVVAGGGVHHRVLMQVLGRRCGAPVESSEGRGIDPDAREAMGFAVLGARHVLGIPSTGVAATGARAGRVLGKLSLPALPARTAEL